jgi:2-polyprenyl-3-methyl-5-hydroxy-6-metoxy-1,4-benzoquinol methylase
MTSFKLVDRTHCALCGGGETALHIPFPEIPVLRCVGCGFMFSGRTLNEQDSAAYYADDFGSLRHLQGQIVNARVNSWAASKLLDFTAVRRVLDVGTGYGFFLQTLRERHVPEVSGVELSHREAAHARDTLGLDVYNGPLGASGFPKESFDLVTSFEVIEHISRPVQFISEMTDFVRPGGFLLVMTDNFASRMAQSGFPKWIPHSHISHFSPQTLQRAMESSGRLKVVRAASYTPWEVLLRDFVYRLRGVRKTPAEAFDLSATLATEMKGAFRLFSIRKAVNMRWAQMTFSESTDGDLIYLLAQRENPAR